MRIRGLLKSLEKACHGLGYIIESVAMEIHQKAEPSTKTKYTPGMVGNNAGYGRDFADSITQFHFMDFQAYNWERQIAKRCAGS